MNRIMNLLSQVYAFSRKNTPTLPFVGWCGSVVPPACQEMPSLVLRSAPYTEKRLFVQVSLPFYDSMKKVEQIQAHTSSEMDTGESRA